MGSGSYYFIPTKWFFWNGELVKKKWLRSSPHQKKNELEIPFMLYDYLYSLVYRFKAEEECIISNRNVWDQIFVKIFHCAAKTNAGGVFAKSQK